MRIASTVPACGAGIGFITFIASMISRVWPFLTLSPTLTKGVGPGLGGEIGRADHGRGHRAGRRTLGRAGEAAPAPPAGAGEPAGAAVRPSGRRRG